MPNDKTHTTPNWIVAVDPAREDCETTIFQCLNCGSFGGEDDMKDHTCQEPSMREKL
jgi:hypothetical protein